jgi:periplasmic protein TonB
VRRVENTALQGWALTALLYGTLGAWLVLSPPVRRAVERTPPTRVTLVESAPRPAEPPPPPPPAPVEPPRRMEAKRVPVKTPVAPAPLLPTPPAPAQASPPPPVAPRRFAVALEATVPGSGGVAVPTAAPGMPSAVRATPGGTSDRADAPAFVVEPDSAPSLVAQPGPDEMRALYPDAARRGGLEGDVKLELEVSPTGEVTGSRVVRSAGNGFDEVAQRLVRKFRFRPATRGGKPVAAVVPWTYKFRLE